MSWVRHGFKTKYLPTRIALYDLESQQLLSEVNVEPAGMHAVWVRSDADVTRALAPWTG